MLHHTALHCLDIIGQISMIYRPYFFSSERLSLYFRTPLFLILLYLFGNNGFLIYFAIDLIVIDYLILHLIFGYSLTNAYDSLFLEINQVIGYYVTLDRRINDLEALKR